MSKRNQNFSEQPESDQPEDADQEQSQPVIPKLRRLPYLIDDRGRTVIGRAIMLRMATQGKLGKSDPEMEGAALVEIVATWYTAEAERLESH